MEDSWEARERRASRRELAVEAFAAAAFAAAAALLVLAGGVGSLQPQVVVLLVGVYGLVARIEFPVGAGYVVPTQLVLIPMLVMLPPAAVPPAVAVGLAGSASLECAFGRI